MPYQQKVVPLGSAGVYLSPVEEISGLDKLRYTVPIEKKKIKPNLLDQAESAWSNVSIPIRDLLLQPASDSAREIGLRKVSKGIDWASDVLNPDSIVVDGKRQGVENKTFNNLSIPELKKEVNAYTTTPDKANGIIYQIRDVNTGDIKWGRSQEKDAFGRWGADKNFGENFEVLQEIPVTDMHYVERLIHGNKNMIKTQTYGWGDQKNSPLTGGGTEIYTNDPLSKESISKVQQLLNPEQIGLAERVYEQLSTVGRKWKLAGQNAGKARIESMGDQYLGAGIGINKAVGGIADLLGDSYGQQRAQQRATQISNTMADKDSASATVGEILPEFGLPAVGYVSKGANLGRRIIQGAGSGAVITGGYEALKEQSGIKEGLETNITMATGMGGVIGGVVGAITKNPTLGKTIGEAFVAGDDKAKEAILQAYPEARSAVKQYFKNNGLAPSKTQPAYLVEDNINPVTGDVVTTKVNRDGVTMSDTIEPDIIAMQKKRVIKPDSKTIKTKDGAVQTSKDLKESKDTLENIELKAVEPKTTVGKELKNQVETERVDTVFKQKKAPDLVNRQHGIEDIGMTGGEANLAGFKEVAKPEIKSVPEELNRQLKIYDEEIGRLNKEQTKAKKASNRLQFEKDTLRKMSRDKTLSDEIRESAKLEFDKIKDKKVKDYIATEAQKALVKEKELSQYKIKQPKSTERIEERRTEYKYYQEAWRDKNGKVYKPKIEDEESIVKVVTKNASSIKNDALEAVKNISIKERLNGREFSTENITDLQRKKYRDEIAKIENVQDVIKDLAEYKAGRIDIHELQYRERRRIDEDIKRDKTINADSVSDAETKVLERNARYNEIGVKSEASRDVQKPSSGKELSDEQKEFVEQKKKERESEEIEKSKLANEMKLKALADYEDSKGKVIPRYKDQKRAGQRILSKEEMQDVDDGLFTHKEIADRNNPIGTKQEQKDLREQRKEEANKKKSDVDRKMTGTDLQQKPKSITFKETFQDVSNSMGQNMAVLLKNQDFGSVVKTAGEHNVKDATGAVTEIRQIIGEDMKSMLPKDFPIKAGKDAVKPMYLTGGYGQGDKGIIDNIISFSRENSQLRDRVFTRAVTRKEAEQFFEAYSKAFESRVPEMKKFKQLVKDLWGKSGGEINYTMPNGFKVKLVAKAELDGTYSIRDINGKLKIKTDSVDKYSSALMPIIMQSVDAFVAHEMGKLGILGKMDAFKTPLGKTDEFVRESYGKIMSQINESNMLEDILKQIGWKGKQLIKTPTLKSEDIMKSAMNEESIAKEEIAGESKLAKPRKREVSSRKTQEQTVKEVMAQNNIYDTPTEQLVKRLSTESNLRDMSRARVGDDVFERQTALAHQSSKYNNSQSVKPPKGSDTEIWNKVQREIFNEARARLEASPNMVGKIQGERKFFTETGKLIGDKTKTYHELLREEIVRGNLEIRKLNREAKQAVKQIAPTYERLQMKVKSWEAGKQLNHAEAMAKEVVHNARQQVAERSVFKKNIDKFKAYFKDQVSDSKVSKDFQKLLTNRTVSETNVAKRAEYLKKDLDARFKGKNQEDLTNAILRTDYHAIQEFKSAEEASKFEEYNKDIYESFKEYIDQSAKAIGEASEQVGFFRNNPKAILAEHNIYNQPVLEEILDKLISIKAMKTKDWETIAKIRDTEDFKFVMDIISDNKKRSSELFHTNPHQQVKGYTSEVYADRFDAETGREAGAIPSTLERKKVGSYEDEFPKGEFSNLKEKSEFAEKNRMKVNHNGSFRKVLDAESKDKAGRSKSFNEILAKTSQSIDAKEVQNLLSKKIIDEMVNGNEMFSQTKKEGYRLIKDNEVSAMPKVVGDSLAGRYVREDYDKRLFGRDEVRLYTGSSHIGKVADRLLKNAVEHFKLNVVLKNLSSHVNAILVNQMLGTMSGINPAKLLKYQAEAFKEMDTVDKLMSKMAILKASGKDFSAVEKELSKSLLYKFEQAGLAVNKLEVGGKSGSFGNKVIDNLYLSQDSKVGKNIYKAFGVYDTQGRYTIAKNAMDNGKTLEEAVAEANGLYSDMNQMAPAIIEIADKYGLIPFAKWFSLTAPRLMKLTKENPTKAIVLGISMYGLQMETNTNLSTVNPLESVVNFADDAITPEFANKVIDDGIEEASIHKAKTFFTPKIYSEIYSELVKPEQHDFFLKRQTKGEFQPLTQRIAND